MVETVEDVIVRKLTAERVEELKKVIKETQEKYRYFSESIPRKGVTLNSHQSSNGCHMPTLCVLSLTLALHGPLNTMLNVTLVA